MTTINTTTKTAANVNAAAAEAVKAEAIVWKAPERKPCEWTAYTVGELLDLWAAGKIARPKFQRQPMSWAAVKGQIERYRDTLLTGIPVPAIVLVRVTAAGTEAALLLVDGCQRLSAAEAVLKELDAAAEEGDENAAAQAEYIRATPFEAMVVTVNTAAEAVELFIRYNMGVKLDGAQTGKANLPAAVLDVLDTYIHRLGAIGRDSFGKKGHEAAAIMIAAAVADFAAYNGAGKGPYKRKATTNAASAAKVLAGVSSLAPIPAPVENVLQAVFAAAPASVTYWASPARLVPLCWAAMETGASAEAIAEVVNTFNPKGTEKARVYTGYKKGCVIRGTITAAAAFGNTANSAAATATRADFLTAVLTGKTKSTATAVNVPAGAAMTAEEAEAAAADLEAVLGIG